MIFSNNDFLKLKNKIENQDLYINILSDSMNPLIKVGDKLKISYIKSRPKIFDILVFFYDNKLYCHYLWKTQNSLSDDNVFITRALKNVNQYDMPINPDNVLGIVINKKISLFKKILIIISTLKND